ncbi:serine/threonine-protein kinase [Nocardia sp. alder85J]|uniref:serine/threonine-protein kinase n=1 Tax=Nocardia sp. alder85J TaxID=2862949 RepID=UPI001CD5BF81|nr:serine/threonine-protein kinase [Nocardia sp. alder85J]MCX4090857.1 serine/threonine-protein kinase [Nocardia sp. alder85J]
MEPGQDFAGYVIERLLGRGSMGEVYLARHPRLPRWVALKVLDPALSGDRAIRARFEREADLAARLDHPNIVAVHDRGIEDDRLWIAMQYVDGADAAGLDARALAPAEAVRIVTDIADALDYAHASGILHRDVRPANILIAAETGNRVLLSDFGIARLHDDSTHRTGTGNLTATLGYAAPEQLAGAEVDDRADQYALACTLYRLLTGNVPYPLTNPAALLEIRRSAPVPVSALRPELPPALDAVLTTALAPHPQQRFAGCGEFAAAAQRALTAPRDMPYPIAPQGSPPPRRGRRTALLAAGATAVLAVAAAAAVGVTNSAPHRAAAVSVPVTVPPVAYAPTTVPGPATTADTRPAAAAALLHSTFPRMVPATGGRDTGFRNAWCGFDTVDTHEKFDTLPFFGDWTVAANCPGAMNADPVSQYLYYLYDTPAAARAVLAGLPPNIRADRTKDGIGYTTYTMSGIGSSGFTYMVTAFRGAPDRERILLLSILPTPEENLAWWLSAPLG